MSTHPDELRPGQRFARYELVARLGEGGMCVVWKAMHPGLRKMVAVKMLKPEHARNPIARERFLREGEAVSRVHHANVVEVHDLGVEDEIPYLVMEFLEGEDLQALFDRQAPLAEQGFADIMVPVCLAVAQAHQAGVVHRDLKPANIFLARTPDRGVVPKVLDFGISRVADDDRMQTHSAAILGTPRYMSPEQARGAKFVDARTDQYSLGVILYVGSTGRVPIDEQALFPLMQRIVAGDFLPPRAVRPAVTPAFEQVVLRAMHNAPDHRFGSVDELAHALLMFASERTRVLFGANGPSMGDTMPVQPTSWPTPPSITAWNPVPPTTGPLRPSHGASASIPPAVVQSAQTPMPLFDAPPPIVSAPSRGIRPWQIALAAVAVMGASSLAASAAWDRAHPAPDAPPRTAAPIASASIAPAPQPAAPASIVERAAVVVPAPEIAPTQPVEIPSSEPTPPPAPSVQVVQPRERPVARTPEATPPRPVPQPTSTTGSTPFQRALSCRASTSNVPETNACMIRELAGHASTDRELALLATTYRSAGQQAAAIRTMRTYIERYPQGPRVEDFRRTIDYYSH